MHFLYENIITIILPTILFLGIVFYELAKLKKKLEKEISAGKFNKKQALVLWLEGFFVCTITIYYGATGLYMISTKAETGKLKEFSFDFIPELISYMIPAFVATFIIVAIGFILLKIFKTKK